MHFVSLMKYSMLKTFAAKYRTKVSKIKAKYVKNGLFTIPYTTKAGTKESTFFAGPFKRRTTPLLGQVDTLAAYVRYDSPNSVIGRLKAKTCELCGAVCDDIELHQVKRLKDLTGQYEWERVMKARRRKTLAVCPACHANIHLLMKS